MTDVTAAKTKLWDCENILQVNIFCHQNTQALFLTTNELKIIHSNQRSLKHLKNYTSQSNGGEERAAKRHVSRGSEYRVISVDWNLCQRVAEKLDIPASELNCELTPPIILQRMIYVKFDHVCVSVRTFLSTLYVILFMRRVEARPVHACFRRGVITLLGVPRSHGSTHESQGKNTEKRTKFVQCI